MPKPAVYLCCILIPALFLGCPGWRGQRPLPEGVWCVSKANVSCREDGRTWRTAFRTIQPAIDAAAQAGGGEVWVAQGVYDEERSPLGGFGALQLRTAIGIYGGFAGTEATIADRDWQTHLAVIDGSHARGGAAAYQVVVAEDDAVLDGVTVRGGGSENPTQSALGGGGVAGTSVRVRHCRFVNNRCRFAGAALELTTTDPEADLSDMIVDCVFENNISGGNGGAIALSSPVLPVARQYEVRGCVFNGNEALAGEGGAIITARGARLSDCRFIENRAVAGGAVSAGRFGAVAIESSEFTGNEATESGGAIRISGRLQLESCVFTGNRVTGESGVGGAVAATTEASEVVVRNSVFWGNEAEAGGALYARGAASVLGQYFPEIVLQQCTFYANGAAAALDVEAAGLLGQNLVVWGQPQAPAVRLVDGLGGSIAVTHSDVQGGYAGTGNLDVDPGFVDPAAGDFRLRADSPLVDAGDGAPARFPYFWQTQDPYPVPAQDLDGQPRPCGPAPDPGAYERCAP